MSRERWCAAIEAAEEETGLYYHGGSCDCADCKTLEARAEQLMTDRLASEIDRAYDEYRDGLRRSGIALAVLMLVLGVGTSACAAPTEPQWECAQITNNGGEDTTITALQLCVSWSAK